MSDDRLERIEVKIDSLGSRLGNVDVTLSAQHITLKEHMRRTAILEQQVIPLVRRASMSDGMLKLIGFVALLGGAFSGLFNIARALWSR